MIDWNTFPVYGDDGDTHGNLTLAFSAADYPSALRLIADGKVSIKVRKPPHHSIQGAGGLSRAISLLIRAKLVEHDALVPRVTLLLRLSEKGRGVYEKVENA